MPHANSRHVSKSDAVSLRPELTKHITFSHSPHNPATKKIHHWKLSDWHNENNGSYIRKDSTRRPSTATMRWVLQKFVTSNSVLIVVEEGVDNKVVFSSWLRIRTDASQQSHAQHSSSHAPANPHDSHSHKHRQFPLRHFISKIWLTWVSDAGPLCKRCHHNTTPIGQYHSSYILFCLLLYCTHYSLIQLNKRLYRLILWADRCEFVVAMLTQRSSLLITV